jgi:hypothetical protein
LIAEKGLTTPQPENYYFTKYEGHLES